MPANSRHVAADTLITPLLQAGKMILAEIPARLQDQAQGAGDEGLINLFPFRPTFVEVVDFNEVGTPAR